MIQKMSDQHKIKFLETPAEEAPTSSPEVSPKTLKSVAEEQKAKKLQHHDTSGLMTSKHIATARTGVITDKGGPKKYVGSETSNSIWDTDKTARLAKETDSKTRVQEEKAEIATNRRTAEQQRLNDLAEALKKTDQRKANSVTPMSSQQGSNYKVPVGGLSIFDTKDFDRVAEKTGGEKVSEEVAKRQAQKDDSWKHDGRPVSTKDITNRLFDSLTKGE